MPYTDIRHHTARFGTKPKGFTPIRGKKPPIRGTVYIEFLHKTGEGWAIGPRTRADLVLEDQWPAMAKAKSEWRLAPDLPRPAREAAGQRGADTGTITTDVP